MDGESSSPEVGATPPNTPVTPSHKTTKEHHRQWSELDKSEPEPAACLGQHHHQRHHYHDQHHHHRHHQPQHHHHNSHTKQHHSLVFEKKLSYELQSIYDAKAHSSNSSSSIYSCYHNHWCVASTPSTPRSSPTPVSPTLSSLSSNCNSEEDLGRHQPLHQRTTNAEKDRSARKSIGDGDDDDDDNDDADQNNDQDQDHSGILPNPGTHPVTAGRFERTRVPSLLFLLFLNID